MFKPLKILRLFFILFLIVSILFFIFIYLVATPRNVSGKKVVFTIKPGQSVREVAIRLQNEKIISNAFVFEMLVRISKDESRIKAGDYELSSKLNSIQILEKFIKGDVIKRIFTIPEGSRIREVSRILEEKHIIRSEDFLSLVNMNKTITIGGYCPEKLEGYLFPDTYQVSYDMGPIQIIEMMARRFEEVVIPVYEESPPEGRLDLPSVITIASLIEKEARLEIERPLISAVFYNRLKKEMPLQCDATIQYILGKDKLYLTYDDLKLKSPYNTYIHKGMPPGPICSPGLSSIMAALYPAKVSYLYYVLNDKKKDGSHVFSISYEEHLEAIKNYQK